MNIPGNFPGRRSLARALALAAAIVLAAATAERPARAASDPWPTSPITIVVATEAGGGFDLMARGLATALGRELGVPVVVADHPGGSMVVGTAYALSQPHDGNTLLVAGPAPFWYADIYHFNAPFKLTDFDILNIQWTDRSAVMVPRESRFNSLKEIVAAVRTNPGTVSVGVVRDSGELYNLAILRDRLGLPASALRIVTYGASAPLRTAIAGGQVDFAVISLDASAQMLQLLKPLAVFGDPLANPPPGLPADLPTVGAVLKSLHVKPVDFVPSSMRAIVVPADFKQQYPDRYKKLLDAYRRVVQNPQFVADSAKQGITVEWKGPQRSLRDVQQAFALFDRYQHLIATP
jgi:tripartite-type tricarboxylate transporter receptor subunit TctC